uniref:Uncharacterized protein n=1 Tax=Chrysemys picta bellii TaxID=8478 RepID=A0A8C3F7G0_CHRPI
LGMGPGARPGARDMAGGGTRADMGAGRVWVVRPLHPRWGLAWALPCPPGRSFMPPQGSAPHSLGISALTVNSPCPAPTPQRAQRRPGSPPAELSGEQAAGESRRLWPSSRLGDSTEPTPRPLPRGGLAKPAPFQLPREGAEPAPFQLPRGGAEPASFLLSGGGAEPASFLLSRGGAEPASFLLSGGGAEPAPFQLSRGGAEPALRYLPGGTDAGGEHRGH